MMLRKQNALCLPLAEDAALMKTQPLIQQHPHSKVARSGKPIYRWKEQQKGKNPHSPM